MSPLMNHVLGKTIQIHGGLQYVVEGVKFQWQRKSLSLLPLNICQTSIVNFYR